METISAWIFLARAHNVTRYVLPRSTGVPIW